MLLSGRRSDVDARGRVDELPAVVAGLQLPKGTETALLASVRAAQASLQRGNRSAAIGQLTAFINKVQAQTGKHISARDAELLVAYATNVIAQI